MADPVTAAETTLADLQQKHADAQTRLIGLNVDRKRVSYDANTTGGDALRRLRELTRDAAAVQGEVDSLGWSIAEAETRVAEARRQAALAEERVQLAKVAPVTAKLRARGKRLDELAAEMKAEAAGMLDDVRELHRLGFARPADYVVMENLKRAIATALMGSVISGEHIAPNLRHSFGGLAAGWGDGIDNDCSRRLGTAEAVAA